MSEGCIYGFKKNKDKQTDVASSKGVARFMTLVFKD